MTPPPYTPEADLAIRSELLSIEAARFPSLNLKRQYIAPCGHTIPCEDDLEAGIDYLDAVYRRECKHGDSLAVWVWILAFAAAALLLAFILTARSVLR